MAIYIDEQKKLFTLSTNNTSYQMMADKYLVLNHLYYGENIGQEDMSYLLDYQDRGFSGNPYEAGNEREYSLDSRPQEYSTNGVGDYRINSVSVINADGSDAADWRMWDIPPQKANMRSRECRHCTGKKKMPIP